MLVGFLLVFVIAIFRLDELSAKHDPPNPPLPEIPPVTCNCSIPPFISNQAKPNILIILDNSNSMDEDFYGGAVGSFSPASMSEIARKKLKDMITRMREMLRIGLMTYRLPSNSSNNNNVQASYIHDSHYFASYDNSTYCPNPPDECLRYCEYRLRLTEKNTCHSTCILQNAAFDVDNVDDILSISLYGPLSAERIKYCSLAYPKTKSQPNPNHITDNNSTIYYKKSSSFYANNNQGVAFCYSVGYDALESVLDTYYCYGDKVGSSNSLSGYSGQLFNASFEPTDSDYALGYKDYGRRINWYSVGPAWYSTTPISTWGTQGYLAIPVNDIADVNGTLTSTYSSLIGKLATMDGNSTRYMSCSASDKNTCSYIVNAGLTPTAGTLRTAYNYFSGTTSSPARFCISARGTTSSI